MEYWLEDSISFLPVFLDEPYDIPYEIPSFDWWAHDQIQPYQAASEAPPAAAAVEQQPATAKSELPKKRKLPGNHFPSAAAQRRTVISGNEEHGEKEDDRKPHTGGGKKGHGGKGSGGNAAAAGGGGGSREARWAEQLLNPLAAAIDTGNVYRVQHLLYVLQELASPAGDANHRLAFHGLQALTRRLPAGTAASAAGEAAPTYVTAEPRMFRSAVIKFHEVSPWFALPNCLANVAILQAAAATGGKNLHIVDAGVSHGVQWPTLLETLAQRAAGMVRLTVVGEGSGGPFGPAPAGYDCGPQLVRYAKSIELKLKVERGEVGGRRWAGDETVVVCVQFRAGRVGPGFWNVVREMEPDLVVVSEREEGQGMAGEFGRRAGVMWRFLESTAAAFKGKDCEERRVVEGEAARFLDEGGEGRERWKQRLEAAGFREEGFGEEAVEAGRVLLRKFDGNWELRVVAAATAAAAAGGVGLWWKGQAVSSCSIWKPVRRAAAAAFVNGYIYQEHS